MALKKPPYTKTRQHNRNEKHSQENQKMKLRIYTIRDNKAEAYNRPFFERTDLTAIRAVKKSLTQDDTYQVYAEDYALYYLGTFDDSNGQIDHQVPLHLVNLIDLRDQQEPTREFTQPVVHGHGQPAKDKYEYRDSKGNGGLTEKQFLEGEPPQGGE